MRTLRDALRAALRGAAARPAFAAVVVLTLAIGIGANTAIFTVADATLRRGLPYPDPDALVTIQETRARDGFERLEASYPNFLDWKLQARAFTALAGYGRREMLLTTATGADLVAGARTSPELFPILGARAQVGRLLGPEDERPDAPAVAVLSHAAWRSRFGGDAGVVGRTISLDEGPVTIVGVLAPGFVFAPVSDAVAFLPLRPEGDLLTRRNLHWVDVVGRLAPGRTLAEGRAELAAIAAGLAAAHPDANEGGGVHVAPLADLVLGKARQIVVFLLAAVGLVLLIACANAANLLLVRQTGRQQELAVRAALGASRAQLVALLTVEAVGYALAAGLCGVVLALWGVDLLVGAVPATLRGELPFLVAARVDAVALAVTFGLSLLTGVAVGVTTALRGARGDVADSLKDDGRASGGRATGRLRDALVVSEVALAFVLLAGAGLVGRSLLAVLATDPGFRLGGVVTAQVRLPERKYRENADRVAAHAELLRRVEALPGVTGAATVNTLPLSSGGNTVRYVVVGREVAPGALEPEANLRRASAGYFRALGVPLVAGRFFDGRDGAEGERVLLVNETLARQEFGSAAAAVGKELRFTYAADQPPRRVVGVVGDVRLGPLDAGAAPALYNAYDQSPGRAMSLVVRGPVTADTLRRTIAGLDAEIAVYDVATIEERVARAPWMFVRRFPALLVGLFGAIALGLTAVGIYAVLSYTVRQRRHEIGIRRAVGAREGQIVGMVVRQALALAAIGLALGLAGALAAARLLSSLLYGVSPWDPVVLVAVGGGLLLVGVIASALPALAASRVDPMEALRRA
jgi:putative ABC transport system permease protein